MTYFSKYRGLNIRGSIPLISKVLFMTNLQVLHSTTIKKYISCSGSTGSLKESSRTFFSLICNQLQYMHTNFFSFGFSCNKIMENATWSKTTAKWEIMIFPNSTKIPDSHSFSWRCQVSVARDYDWEKSESN